MRREPSIDFVFLNEGVYSLRELVALKDISFQTLMSVPGLAVRRGDDILFTAPPTLVPQDKMDEDMPGYAWDLLPCKTRPLDLYRAPYWHAEYQDAFRSPYAAIQTSIGCRFKCSFCMINLINKNDAKPESVASDYNGMRHWSRDLLRSNLKI